MVTAHIHSEYWQLKKNDLVENGDLKIGSVIKLEEYASNVLSKDPPKVVVILLNFEILGEMETNMQNAGGNDVQSKPAAPVQNENIEPKAVENKKSFYSKEPQNQISSSIQKPKSKEASAGSQGGATFNNLKIFGISSLNPYQNKWSIKVRVTNKSAIRTYSNARGDGKLFNVELIDQTGEIRANGFNEQVDKFYDLLQIDQVYYISRATLKTANKQYSKLDNDYEMTFNNDTVIEPCNESDDLPRISISLLPLKEIANKNANDYVDIIGVVKSTSDVTTIVTKATNKELKKREIHLVDNSNFGINCTLWGKQAEDFDGSENPVIMLKGARIGDYGGRTLSVAGSTVMQINPDIPEAHTLRGWFDQGGNEACMQELSNQLGSQGATGGGGSISSNWKYLDQLRDEKLGQGDKADYLSAKATILYAKKDNCMYMACATESCNKKVVDQNNGTYMCEKCAKSSTTFKWRLILSVNIGDFADSNWATCFQDSAEAILGVKAEELGEYKTNNDPRFDEIFNNVVFRDYNFKLRAKMETYNDERRVKVSVVTAEPIDYVANGRRLLQSIKAYAKSQ